MADEQAITEALVVALAVGEEGDQLGQPAVAAGLDIGGGELVGQFLQPRRVGAGAEGVGALLEGDALRAEPAGQPLVAIEADAGAEGEVGADAQEHPAEVLVLEVEVVLLDEAVEQLNVVTLAGEADGHAGVLAGLEDDGDAVLTVQLLIERLDPLLAADAPGGHEDLDVPFLGEGLDEVMVVCGDGLEVDGGHPVRLALLLEEADDAGGVLEDLDDAVEKDAVEAGVVEADSRLVVLDEGVHGGPPDQGWASPPMIPGPAFIWGFQGASPLA